MSTMGSGVVVAVPAVVIIGVPVVAVGAAVAIGGIGVVVAQQAGKAVLACGREMKAMAEQNRAMQRSLQQAALRYEEKLRQQEREHSSLHSQELQKELQKQRSEVQQREQRMNRLRQRPKSVEMINWDAIEKARAEVLASAPPPAITEHHRISGWEQRLKRVRIMADGLHRGLEYFTSGAGQNLFVLAGLKEMLHDAEQRLRELESNAVDVVLQRATVPASDLETLLATLEYVDGRLQEMRVQIPQKRSQRQATLTMLEQANQALNQTLLRSDATDYVAGLKMLQDMLNEASAKIEEAKFERAFSTAEAVLKHLEHVETMIVQQRQKNLYVLMHTCRMKTDPLEQLPELAERVASWQRDYDSIVQIAASDIERAWTLTTQSVTGLLVVAAELQQAALNILLQHQSSTLAGLTKATLQEMGYEIIHRPEEDDLQFIQGSRGRQRMYVTLSQAGDMRIKADGFGDASCQPEMQKFLQLLQEKGVQGAWQEKFVLTEALQRLLRLLQEAGLNVKVEPTDDGVTVVASGALGATAEINYDGKKIISRALLEQLWRGHIQENKSYDTINQELDDAWESWQTNLIGQRDAAALVQMRL